MASKEHKLQELASGAICNGIQPVAGSSWEQRICHPAHTYAAIWRLLE